MIVLISESMLRRSRVVDGRLLRDRMLCGFCVRMNPRKRAFKVATSVAGIRASGMEGGRRSPSSLGAGLAWLSRELMGVYH